MVAGSYAEYAACAGAGAGAGAGVRASAGAGASAGGTETKELPIVISRSSRQFFLFQLDYR